MKSAVFIDTGFWIALLDARDRNHAAARVAIRPLLENRRNYLSDFIVFETITYLNCSLKRHDLAIRFLDKTRNPVLNVLSVDEAIKADALLWFRKYSDKHLSMTDCTSFALMTRNDIRDYAGFDSHFRQMGFNGIMEGLNRLDP